ncbi:hypothetical protein O3G_MSEX013198 [Manduca sexta]|uniref:Uncharacterized protein n=2 Tax=Manduca sexta TaxID=7130 RepID=A0A922CXN7_MANSE|nr:hypothetical protein O3G_MSEX013198 [Manduca sexta]
MKTLIASNTSRYFWLPGRRQKPYNPVVWYIPGPNWGRYVLANNYLKMQTLFLQNCLLLDVEQRLLLTESCNNIYPSLCLYINDMHQPSKCPKGYYSFRFKSNHGTCFGIETSDSVEGSSFDEFIEKKCRKPMSDDSYDALSRFIFKKIAEKYELPDDQWCWFKLSKSNSMEYDFENITSVANKLLTHVEGAINNAGTLGLLSKMRNLSCMACETDVIYGDTQLVFEYDEKEIKFYLTVYSPSGLWKYNDNDKGVRCFSNAKGFAKRVDVSEAPIFGPKVRKDKNSSFGNAEKIVYAVNLVTDHSAEYWCEGHTKNLSLLSTGRLTVNPRGNEVHVFSLVIKYEIGSEFDDAYVPNMTYLLATLTEILHAQRVLFMDILVFTMNDMLVVLHVHVPLNNPTENETCAIQTTLNFLKETLELELPKYNSTFVNISSSLYCLPTTSIDFINLNWDLTPIGQVATPRQFCLQSNGLPVTRQCQGSFLLGSLWGDVEGTCDINFRPSTTTTFLYNIVSGQAPNNYTTNFLTDGLSFVLEDLNIIIPADIYYLSMSLQQILHYVQENETSVELGDIENIAWAMDRMLVLDNNDLRLAQTLNSTNILLNSVNEIIEILAHKNITNKEECHDNIVPDESYQLIVKPKFIVQVSFPKFNNITGIAIYNKGSNETFNDMIIKPLYLNTTIEDVLFIKNLEIATWIPNDVLDNLKVSENQSDSVAARNNSDDFHIIINIFHNDAVFQELGINKHVVKGRVIGVTIPGYISNFEYSVPLLFRDLNYINNESFCGYWDFKTRLSSHIPGTWKNQGCYIVKNVNNVTICECYHLTHFGHLLIIPGLNNNHRYDNGTNHNRALNIITLVGSFLSLVGIAGIWITALMFSNWRKKASTKVLLQLSTAIALPLLFIITFSLDYSIFINKKGMYVVANNKRHICVILGALLHYSILSSFMWMLITAILQFVRYVRVLGVRRPSKYMIKFALIGWGIPLLPVIIILAINTDNYIPSPSVSTKICYPNGIYAILGILVPVSIILCVNVTLFVLVLHSISRKPEEKMQSTDMDLIAAQLRLSIFLFFLLGLTWVFGILSFTNNLLWSYLFCLSSTLQGFVLFVYFIICDPATRNLWVTLVTPQDRSSSSRNSITSYSTT